jgi:phenylalanyl-tRNA synthetase beta chain
MDIKILDSWLREYLDAKISSTKLAEYLSLCGPSVERIKDFGQDKIYEIEITTNRIDSASVYGIAREASAILPRFNVAAKLNPIGRDNGFKFLPKVDYLKAIVDPTLCPRFSAVLIRNVKYGESPQKISKRLESAGVRSINNIVDISNYIMLELGQPVHTFDYDKIKDHKMLLRESKKGEKIETLDNKSFTLPGGDIVIEDGSGRLIDLAGIMGGNLSAVDDTTKNVLLFVQTYNSTNIRKTSMALAQRTMAATIFEKGTDTELTKTAILKALNMFKEITKGSAEKQILDIYKSPIKLNKISVSLEFIKQRLGIPISKSDISSYLKALQFSVSWNNENLTVEVPSFRNNDIKEDVDVIEEIARIYGYHNLPSRLMTGDLPGRSSSPIFTFEENIKNFLSGLGGNEVYTLSLVRKEYAGKNSLKIKNPLGSDSEYLRTTLMPSLLEAAVKNSGTTEIFHIFEMANIYLPVKNRLPKEILMLAGIFEGYSHREAKGIVEALFEKLHINFEVKVADNSNFAKEKCLEIRSGKTTLGYFGYLNNSKNIYYELDVETLYKTSPKKLTYKEIPKFPAQVEDITLILPERLYLSEIVKAFSNTEQIKKHELMDTYGDRNYTFRLWFQNEDKTLTDTEVEKIRNKLLDLLITKYGVKIK